MEVTNVADKIELIAPATPYILYLYLALFITFLISELIDLFFQR